MATHNATTSAAPAAALSAPPPVDDPPFPPAHITRDDQDPDDATRFASALPVVGLRMLSRAMAATPPAERRDRRVAWTMDLEALAAEKKFEVKAPRLGGRRLDLFALFCEILARGGIQNVIDHQELKLVGRILGLPRTCTSAAHILRITYSAALYPYEQALVFDRPVHLAPEVLSWRDRKVRSYPPPRPLPLPHALLSHDLSASTYPPPPPLPPPPPPTNNTSGELAHLLLSDADLARASADPRPRAYSNFPNLFDPVVRRLCEVHMATEAEAQWLAYELYRCLFVKSRATDPLQLALPPRLEAAWREAVLNTEPYARFCVALGGQFLHHSTVRERPEVVQMRLQNMRVAYEAEWGPSDLWRTAAPDADADNDKENIEPLPQKRRHSAEWLFS